MFFVLLAALALSDFYFFTPFWAYLILVIVFVADIGFGAANMQCNYFLDAKTRVNTLEKKIAITFDDGPCENTPKLLEILQKHKATATFFCIGKNVEKHPEVVKAINEQGHTIGNHSFSHHFFIDFFGKKKMIKEITRTDEAIEKITGEKPVFFRPPYGVTNPPIAKALKKTGHKAIGWNIRSLDTLRKKDEKLVKQIKSKISPGAILLLHDHVEKSDWLLDEILTIATKKGYTCVGLDELVSTKR